MMRDKTVKPCTFLVKLIFLKIHKFCFTRTFVHSNFCPAPCTINLARTSLIKFDNVGDVLIESPEKISEALTFFC